MIKGSEVGSSGCVWSSNFAEQEATDGTEVMECKKWLEARMWRDRVFLKEEVTD